MSLTRVARLKFIEVSGCTQQYSSRIHSPFIIQNYNNEYLKDERVRFNKPDFTPRINSEIIEYSRMVVSAMQIPLD